MKLRQKLVIGVIIALLSGVTVYGIYTSFPDLDPILQVVLIPLVAWVYFKICDFLGLF